jgi:porin
MKQIRGARPGDVLMSVCMGTILTIFAGTFTSARAQSDPSGLPQPLPIAQPYPSPPPAATPPQTSPLSQITMLGKTLQDAGVYLQLGYTLDLNSLVSGGFKTGTMPTGELFFGTVLDLQKILGIPEGSFHITFDERSGFSLNGNVGTQGPLEANSGPTRAIRLSELYYEQGFYHDRIDIRVGRTSPTTDFATSDIACEFVASIICAQPGTWYFSNGNNAYPSSSWGGFLNIAATPHVYFRAGAFDDDPSQSLPNQNGFNFNVKGSTGVFVPAELGYQTNFSNARYPAKYDVGGYWDDADYTTPQGIPMHGRTAVYAQAEQTVWRPDPDTNQSLTVFGGGIWYNGGAPYWSQIYGGVYDRAPFTARPDDTIGVIASYYANNSIERPNKPSQWIFEVNYGFQVAAGVTVKPYTQYVIAPNNLGAPVGSPEPSDAWVVGLQVSIDLAHFLGFPKFVPF